MKLIFDEPLSEQVFAKKFKRELTTIPSEHVKLSQNEPQLQLSRPKFEYNDTPNEFTSGYVMKPVEMVVIAFVLVLWVLSLRKFFKTFGKLRTTHYRDVPYKYKLKDPHNIGNIKIVNNQNESVIYSRDPIKSLKISLYQEDTTPLQAKCNMSIESDSCPLSNTLRLGSNSFSCLNMYENESIYDNRYHYDANGMRKKNSISNGNVTLDEDNKNYLNPMYSLSPIVRKSLLDLHKKSIENLAQTTSNTNSEHTTPKNGGNFMAKIKGGSSNSFSNQTNRKRLFQKEHLTVKFLESPV